MSLLGQLAAGVAATLHVLFFCLESLWFTRPAVYRRFGVPTPEAAEAVRPMAFNQGFYNLFLAIGAFVGIVVLNTGSAAVGRTLIIFACGCMALAALVLVGSSPRLARAAAVQGILPLIAVGAMFLAR